MGKNRRVAKAESEPEEDIEVSVEGADDGTDELVPEEKLVCSLTGGFKSASPQEEVLQSLIEQLHREYGITLEDMARDVRITCYAEDTKTGKLKARNRSVSLIVYESAEPREVTKHHPRAVVAKPGTKPDDKALQGSQ